MSTEIPSVAHRPSHSVEVSNTGTSISQTSRKSYHLANSQSYAQNSESDMDLQAHPSTPPRTPRKHSPSTAHVKSNHGAETGGKQRNKNKNRPKNVNVSPAVTKSDRQTPPLKSAGLPSSRPLSTPSAPAYAGSTFHASPAPSALPIPSFYSKSVPDSPAARALERSRDASVSSIRQPSNPSSIQQISESQREESPLDIFFKADREEKARARSASSAQQAMRPSGPFQPPLSPRSSRTPPNLTASDRQFSDQSGRTSASGGIFAFEMDGASNSKPFGPAFSTPYSERISAARASGNSGTQQNIPAPTAYSTDRSAALKNYLFNGYQPPTGPQTAQLPNPSPSRTPYHGIDRYSPTVSTQNPRINGRSSGLRREVSPSKTPTKTPDRQFPLDGSPTPSRQARQIGTDGIGQITNFNSSPNANQSNERKSDTIGLESHLRRILKLDSTEPLPTPK